MQREADATASQEAAPESLDLQRRLGNRTTYELIERLRDSPALGALLQGHGPYQHVVVDEVTPVPGVVGNRAIAQALTANDSSRTDLRITSAGGAAEAQAESVARGADTTITPVTEAGGAVPPDSARSVLARPSQAGRALPEVVRADLEGRLGSDLSQVRVHTDPSALAAAEALDANAFTVGAHIYLGGGADPESASGRRLLAARGRTRRTAGRHGGAYPAGTQNEESNPDRHEDHLLRRSRHRRARAGRQRHHHPQGDLQRPSAGRQLHRHRRQVDAAGRRRRQRAWLGRRADAPPRNHAHEGAVVHVLGRGRMSGHGRGPGDRRDRAGRGESRRREGRWRKDTGGVGAGAKGQGQAEKGEGPGSQQAEQTGPGTGPGGRRRRVRDPTHSGRRRRSGTRSPS